MSETKQIFVAEIFGPTIQGEGPNVGIKTLFVRVAGCDFKCDWCDSKFAWSTENAMRFEPKGLAQNLLLKCWSTHTKHVILTGGNPCIYDFTKVIKILHSNDITVDVETQGSIYPDWLAHLDTIVISPKAPSSKMPDVYAKLDEYLKCSYTGNRLIVKIPIFNDEDFQFAEKYYKLISEYRKLGSLYEDIDLYLSVGNDDVKEEGDISNRILNSYRNLIEKVSTSDMERVFVLPQVHTLVWGNKQGV